MKLGGGGRSWGRWRRGGGGSWWQLRAGGGSGGGNFGIDGGGGVGNREEGNEDRKERGKFKI